MKYTNVHYALKDVSQHATIFMCPKNNVQTLVTTGDDTCDSCLRPLDGEPESQEKCPYCDAKTVVSNSRGVWCETCEKDIYWNDLDRGY